jgi:hypothetical protein
MGLAFTVLFVDDDPQIRGEPTLQIMFAAGYAVRANEAAHLGKLLFKPMRAQQIETELCELMSVR